MRADLDGESAEIDVGVFNSTRADLGDAIVATIIDTFISECGSRLQDPDDLATVRRDAHTLRGNCVLFGATHLASLLERLETASREGDRESSQGLLSEVRMASERVTQRLGQLRQVVVGDG
jgi:HPt (histidine-containing phosphotransfer) domain-containing protein